MKNGIHDTNLSSYSQLTAPVDRYTHSLVSTFLEILWEWRSDLRATYDLTSYSGAFRFLAWWLQWGIGNYRVLQDFGVSTAAAEQLFAMVQAPEGAILDRYPIFFLELHAVDAALQRDFPLGADGKPCPQFCEWIVNWGATSFHLSGFSENSPAFCLIRAENSRFSELNWLQHVALLKSGLLNDAIACMAPTSAIDQANEILKLPEWNPVGTTPIQSTPLIETDSRLNLFGVPSQHIGIGEDARLMHEVCELAGVTVNDVDRSKLRNIKKSNLNLFCLPAPDVVSTLVSLPVNFIDGAYNIASCPWELPVWPESLEFVLKFFDEIWVHSVFVERSIPASYRGKVRLFPLPVTVERSSTLKRVDFGLPETDFLFFTSFDFSSALPRKNPMATIEAFKKAFAGFNNVRLVIKTNSSRLHPERRAWLETFVNDPRITVIDQFLSKADLHALYQSCDCFVSLHRAEGFGRNIAESMLLNRPVVVTDYSGNQDFCTSETAYLVPFKIIPLKGEDYIFSRGQFWAEPDVNAAAEILKTVMKDASRRKKITAAAQVLISTRYSLSASATALRELLASQVSFDP